MAARQSTITSREAESAGCAPRSIAPSAGWTPGDLPLMVCEHLWRVSAMGWRWTLLGIPALLGGCAEPEPLFFWERHPGGAWCYHTIAEPDCYPVPLPGEADRLIASGPEVYFSWRPNPALE